MSLKLVSVNIEGIRHLDAVTAFLQKEQPDVVCLQEVFEESVEQLAESLLARAFYTRMSSVVEENIHLETRGMLGLLQLVAPGWKVQEHQAQYYVGSPENTPIFFHNENPNALNRAVSWVTVERETDVASGNLPNTETHTIATTHFTWSPKGSTTDEQLRDFSHMEQILHNLPPHIFCGDLNAPRGKEIFSRLSQTYTDNVPPEVTSTLDPKLHRNGKIELVVDGLFSSPGILVKDVRIVQGISDHCAIVATIG